MPKKKPVWGMVLHASSSIEDLFANLNDAMVAYGKYDSWTPGISAPIPSGATLSRAQDEWQAYASFRRTADAEDRSDELDVYSRGNTALENGDGQPETLTYRAKEIADGSSRTHYVEWKLIEKKSKIGMLALADKSETGTTITRDVLWTAKPKASEIVSYGDKTKQNLLKHLGSGFEVEDERVHIFLVSGDKQIKLGDRNDVVSTFFPDHYLENNGHWPDRTDQSPTGRYKGGSVIDGGGGFDRLIYDDGEYYYDFKQLPRSEAQQFMRKDFKISTVGNPLDGVFEIKNKPFGWTDKIMNIEELEFAVRSGWDAEASVTVNIKSPFSRGDDRFDFNGKLPDLEQKATFGMTFGRAGGGDDHVRLPSQFAVLKDGTLDADGKSNTFYAGKGDDVILGGSKQDFIRGGKGDDTINGDSNARTGGPDKLFGEAGDDVLSGGKGKDWLNGGKGGDVLWGGGGKDYLQGGKGRDALTGDGGNDKMQGGNGSDTFVFSHNFGRDRILDFTATGPRSQQDHIEFRKLVDEAETAREFKAASKQVGNKVIYDAHDDGQNRIVLNGVDMDDLTGFNFDFL